MQTNIGAGTRYANSVVACDINRYAWLTYAGCAVVHWDAVRSDVRLSNMLVTSKMVPCIL